MTGGRTKNPLRSTIKNSEIHPIHVLRHQKAAEARRTEDAKTLEGWQTSLPVRSSWWNCVCPSCPSNTSFKKVNFILKYNINENPQTRSVWLTEFFWGEKKKEHGLIFSITQKPSLSCLPVIITLSQVRSETQPLAPQINYAYCWIFLWIACVFFCAFLGWFLQ